MGENGEHRSNKNSIWMGGRSVGTDDTGKKRNDRKVSPQDGKREKISLKRICTKAERLEEKKQKEKTNCIAERDGELSNGMMAQ